MGFFGLLRFAHGDAQGAKQVAAFIVRRSGSHENDIEADLTLDLVKLDFGENGLVGDADGIVPVAVKGLVGKTAEVANVRSRNIDEAVQEFPHAGAAQRYAGSQRFAFTYLEVGHALAGIGDGGLLSGDFGDFINGIFHGLLAVRVLAHAGGDNNLLQAGNLMHVLVCMLRLKAGNDLFTVVCLQCWCTHCFSGSALY